MFIVVSILLILVKLGNLYVTAELYNNIDDYVLVYNHIKGIKKGSIFILLSLKSKNLKQNKIKEAAQSTPSPSGQTKLKANNNTAGSAATVQLISNSYFTGTGGRRKRLRRRSRSTPAAEHALAVIG